MPIPGRILQSDFKCKTALLVDHRCFFITGGDWYNPRCTVDVDRSHHTLEDDLD